jgi:hypothetical protein
MSANIEHQIDAQIVEVTRLDGEILRVAETLAQLLEEVRDADTALEKTTVVQAGIELAARLAGGKQPKPSPEVENARSHAARLAAMNKAAELMLADLQAARAGAITEADRLVRETARLEFLDAEKQLALAWTAFSVAYAAFSASAHCAGMPRGWNGPLMMEGLRYESCDGLRVQQLDTDTQAFVQAIAASNAGRLKLKLDEIRNQ